MFKQYANIFVAVIGVLLFCDLLLPLLSEINANVGEVPRNLTYKFIALLIYVCSALLIYFGNVRVQKIIEHNKILFFLILLSLTSVFWSVNLIATFQKSVGLVGTTLFGIFLYLNFNLPQFIRILILSFFIIALVSLSMIYLFPDISIHSSGAHEGLWKGAFTHKNIMARVMAMAVILSVIDLFEKFSSLSNLLKISTAVTCSYLLVMSGGKTGILITFFLLVILYPILKLVSIASQQQKIIVYNTLLFLSIGGFILLIVIIKNAQAIVGSVGGDLTLTGRTLLWGIVIFEALENPLLGYGYGAFWESNQAQNVWNMAGWEPPHAHNGFLDLWLDLGLIGLLLFGILIIRYFKNGIKRLPDKDGKGVILLLILCYLILYAIPGNSIVSQNSLSWFLFIYVMLYASNYRMNERRFNNIIFKLKRV